MCFSGLGAGHADLATPHPFSPPKRLDLIQGSHYTSPPCPPPSLSSPSLRFFGWTKHIVLTHHCLIMLEFTGTPEPTRPEATDRLAPPLNPPPLRRPTTSLLSVHVHVEPGGQAGRTPLLDFTLRFIFTLIKDAPKPPCVQSAPPAPVCGNAAVSRLPGFRGRMRRVLTDRTFFFVCFSWSA